MLNEKEMRERYIYEVTKRVPQEIREEIRLELEALIRDMAEEEGMSVEEVIQKLGDPAEFAKRYKDGPEYLIGPDYYDNYMWVMKIALLGIGISALISAIAAGITESVGIVDFFTNFFTELFTTAITGAFSIVGVITIIFAMLEYQKVKISMKPEKNWQVGELSKNVADIKTWTPNSLPPVPDKRAVISRGDSIFSIIFITVFAALLIFAPEFFGAFHYDGENVISIASIFNLEAWNYILPFFLFSLFVGLLDEVVRLAAGYYSKSVMISSIICNGIIIICDVILLKVFPLWNPDFAEQIKAEMGINKFSDGDILRFWGSETFNNYVLGIMCVIASIEIFVAVYKTIRYSK